MVSPLDAPVVCPSLVGRGDQLDALRQVARRVADAAGQTLLISGEAGVGKSRLVRELAGQLEHEGWLIQQGSCFERDRLLPYAPFLDAVHAMLLILPPAEVERCLGPALPDLARLLPELDSGAVDSVADPEQEKRRIFFALDAVFSRLAARQPLLLVLEDLHWADDTSLELLAMVARRVPREHILLLGTYRDDEVSQGLGSLLQELDRSRLALELRLARLERAGVAAMLQAIFGFERPIRPEFLQAIYMLTEGNPFFIEELLRSLPRESDNLALDTTSDRLAPHELRLPRTVNDAVLRRTNGVSPEARRVLVIAAVAGRRFDFELLQTLSGLGERELLHILKELIAGQLVIEVGQRGDHFAFRHALTRQAVYRQLLGRERRGVHRRIGDILEQSSGSSRDAKLEDLAYHFAEAGVWDKALEYAEQAGERADALYAPTSAVAHYALAIDAARMDGIPPPARLHRARGLGYGRLGEFDRARADHETALVAARLAGDRRLEWQSLMDLGLLWAGRAYEQTHAYFTDALQLARRLEDPLALAHSLNRVGNWLVNVEHPADGERYHREALAIFEQLGDRSGLAETLDLLGLARYMQADLMAAVEYRDRAIALFRELDDRAGLVTALAHRAGSVTTYHSATAAALPRFQLEATELVQEAVRLAQELAWPAAETFARMILASVLGRTGDYSNAVAQTNLALDIAEDIDHRQWMSGCRYTLAEIYRELFALDQARDQFQEALQLAREVGSGNWINAITGSLASTLLATGDTQGAAALLAGAMENREPPATMGQRQVRLAAAELALWRGDADEALRLADQLRGETITAPSVDFLRARALRTRGRLEDAEAALRGAYKLASAGQLASVTWRLQSELAATLDAQGRGAEADVARAEALAAIDEIAGRLTDARLASVFAAGAHRAMGIPARTRHRLARGPRGLTTREREVAALIARGQTNRAMAERLVLSERTIETHVSGILGKLGFSSRAQIAAWATEEGLSTT